MQSVSAAFTAEEIDRVRSVTQDLLVSWKKESNLGGRTFTIGVSLIGGNDIIGINPGAIGSPGNYSYFEESQYVTNLAWERNLKMPVGGLSKGMGEAELDNTSGRFTPRYMGGTSELFTAILPRRPFIINAGFEVEGVSQTIPQFSGILDRQPEVSSRERRMHIVGSDYVDFFENRYLDQEVMFTGLRTDEVYEDLLVSMGLSTAQYVLDTGINIIPFGLFESGTKYSNIFDKLAEAENGQFYQDEEGIFRFENRQHWDSSPHNSVERIVLTSQVLEAEAPDTDHIINVVEIKAKLRAKQPNQVIFTLGIPLLMPPGNSTLWVDFDDPILEADSPVIVANSSEDGTGTNKSNSVSVSSLSVFAQAAKYVLTNSASTNVYITSFIVRGRPAKVYTELYHRSEDDSSMTAYEQRPLLIENDYIQSESWADSYSQMILNDFSNPENLQTITIRAIPSLQLGDLISWQGRDWRIFGIRSSLSVSSGFVQELKLLQRTITTYFRIGISTIGGSDKIAP